MEHNNPGDIHGLIAVFLELVFNSFEQASIPCI